MLQRPQVPLHIDERLEGASADFDRRDEQPPWRRRIGGLDSDRLADRKGVSVPDTVIPIAASVDLLALKLIWNTPKQHQLCAVATRLDSRWAMATAWSA